MSIPSGRTDNQSTPDLPPRRSEWFRGSLPYAPSSFVSVDELDPTSSVHTHPTPLDPGALRFTDGGYDYRGHSMSSLMERVNAMSDRVGLLPEDYGRAAREIESQSMWRCDRNQESFERLMNAVDAGKNLMGDEMANIIDLARVGEASLPQLVRLLADYPEMISAESFKFTKPFDFEAMDLARKNLENQVLDLARNFHGDKVTLYFGGDHTTRLKDVYIDDTGVCVKKFLLADVGLPDRPIQIIAKTTELVVSPGSRLNQPLPQSQEIVFDGVKHDAYLLPLSLTAYLRTGDYQKRAGYEHSDLGARAVKAAETLKQLEELKPKPFIPPGLSDEHLIAYAEGLTAAKNSSGLTEPPQSES